MPSSKEYLNLKEVITVNEFNEFVREIFSVAGDIAIKSMLDGRAISSLIFLFRILVYIVIE